MDRTKDRTIDRTGDRTTCPTCGAEIDADHPQGLCPACLLKEGLESETTIRGTRLLCKSCQSALGEDARFCAECGAAAPLVAAAEGDPVRTALEAKLAGQYRIVRLLGSGGMGAVYLARDLTLDREVAIKVVKTDSDTRELYDRLRREARTSARLAHPNIVPLHAFGEVEGMPYFVMGYVRGESLAARLRRDGKMPEDEARRVVAEIADALDHAHRQGVVHRDIKPDNVLLEDESGRALLTDFGVAKALGKGETLTRLGSVVGTPHFMSPEQAAGRADIDGRSDIYSLGVMAYAMLAGRLPFDGSTPVEVLTKHLTQEPPPLRSLAATASDSTVQAVERCLAKDPAARWPDARSLKLALGAIEESQLSDSLHAVEGRGLAALVIGLLIVDGIYIALTQVALAFNYWWFDSGVQNATFVIGVWASYYVFVIMNLRREGFSVSQSQSVIWREPSWWLFWYPRALRRRGNVWDRLPATVRHFRYLNTVAVLLSSLSTITFLAMLLHGAESPFSGKIETIMRSITFSGAATTLAPSTITMSALTVMLVLWFVLRIRAKRELQRNGLGPLDTFRVLISVPPSRMNFWARPHIAAILAPITREATGRRYDSPHDQLQSILGYAGELSGPLRPLGAQAAVAARQVVASIDEADREIAELARNLEPGEEERLADKIEALAVAPGGDDDYAPMRSLLEKQLELIRGLSARIEEARNRRNRRVEMLKNLALHLASLRARSAETPAEVLSLSDRVRALCDDIGRGGGTGDSVP